MLQSKLSAMGSYKSGQAAIEYALIAALILLIVVPTAFLFYRSASGSAQEIDYAQINRLGNNVVKTAETVYYLGPPSRLVIEERLPQNVEGIRIVKEPGEASLFIIDVKVNNEISNFAYLTEVNIVGAFDEQSVTPGMKKIRMEADRDDSGQLVVDISFKEPGRAFATSAAYNGNLGGLSGADAKCQALASAAGLGGEWKAWLSSSSENAKDRIFSRKYLRIDGLKVAINKGDLTDGVIANPIHVDESGAKLGTNEPVWTGTTANGNSHTDNCNDWTASTGNQDGRTGQATQASSWWTDVATMKCNSALRIYCFEQ